MFSKLIHPLLVLIATASDRELAQALQYLKIENRILRDRLPRAIRVTPQEQRQLHKFGVPLGPVIKDLITIPPDTPLPPHQFNSRNPASFRSTNPGQSFYTPRYSLNSSPNHNLPATHDPVPGDHHPPSATKFGRPPPPL